MKLIDYLIAHKEYIALSIPMWTRAYYSLKNGGGLVGVWNSIMFGTNQPKDAKK
jgi:hypothetical protein